MRALFAITLFLLIAPSWVYAGDNDAVEQPTSANSLSSMTVSLDGHDWLLAIDPGNVGRTQSWWKTPRPDAKPTKVPWIIQEAFPGYHGIAWYWRTFTPPKNPHVNGRYLLRFWAVDYQAEVWLNGVHIGRHEGGEGVFVLDATKAIKPQEPNILAVRVLNPTNQPIDGIVLKEVPRRCKVIPFRAGSVYNDGGIVDSVELLVVPPIRINDLFVHPDPKTGKIAVEAKVQSTLKEPVPVELEFTVSPAANGETLKVIRYSQTIEPGKSQVEASLGVDNLRLWQLNDPYLYRVTVRIRQADAVSFDEQSTRCGFRDFRFENGYFRLNGHRIFLKCSHTSTHYPIGLHYPHDPDLARRDLLLAKTMGFNAIRFFCAVPTRYQLDLCDELGLMVYEESYAGWLLQPSPKMAERFDREITEMILRDRNHPSIVMWGLLNETTDGTLFRHAIKALPLVKALDDTRIVMLNSGLFTFVPNRNNLEGISIWRDDVGQEPNVTFNGLKGNVQAVGVLWQPKQLALHPGQRGEYCVLRWTAPKAGKYVLSAKFSSIAKQATTDVHILHQGRSLFSKGVNLPGYGPESCCKKTIAARAGDMIDFVVGFGNGGYGGDTTALDATIVAEDKTTYDAASDFSIEKNPKGVWSYGYLQPGESPDAASFTQFTMGETVGAKHLWGALSNPGSEIWEDVVSDQHPYKRVPHTAKVIHELRTASDRDKPVFVSEYGVGSGVDLAKTTRHFEQLGAEELEDARWYRQRLDRFMTDWRRWNLGDTFASPEDYFTCCLAKMGRQRLLGINALRANPKVVGYSMTGTVDQANCGEGLFTTFRDLKPGTVDCVFDGWYPLRWCLFVEPVNVYRKTPVRLEAILSDEDTLQPGEYPVNLRVVGPGAKCVFDRTIKVTIPDRSGKTELPMAKSVFAEDVVIDGPSGKYRFLVSFKRGAAAAGGETEFYVADPADLPHVRSEVVLWGEDPALANWLKEHGVSSRTWTPEKQKNREVILVSSVPQKPGGAVAFRELAAHIARGSTAVFISPHVFRNKKSPLGWLPLVKKGGLTPLPSWLYHKDEWAKRHPIFDGLPAGGLMDYTFYREIIPEAAWTGQDVPSEVVAGATNTSVDYSAGLMVSVHNLGAGRFILNTLHIRENIGVNPAADRLLLNMLSYAARNTSKPLADLPADYNSEMKNFGY